MKRTSKISLILLTSTTFLAGCSNYHDKDCKKDKKGNCIQSNDNRVGYGYPIYHSGSYNRRSGGYNTSKSTTSSSHISRGGGLVLHLIFPQVHDTSN